MTTFIVAVTYHDECCVPDANVDASVVTTIMRVAHLSAGHVAMFQVQARDVDHAVSIVHRAYFGKRPEKTYASTVVHALEDVPQLFDIEMT